MAMKLHFEPDLDFQQDAINAVVDLFRGQEFAQSEFTVSRQLGSGQMGLEFDEAGVGRGNRLLLLDDTILENLQQVQARNGLAPDRSLRSMDFTVEMETGTGKTYVYLRTIFELHERYGFTKFVIVVPSIAIREGTFKTIKVTAEHLRGLYQNIPFSEGSNYFVYDSSKPGQVRNFATAADLQIMVITASAMRAKDVVRFYQPSEQTNDEPLINLVKQTRPIVIIDEPQRVDANSESQGRRAINDLAPLFTLRYSATHAEDFHKVYRLDPVDAYERQLVKQIEVASATVKDAHNLPYVRFVAARTRKRTIVEAQVELHVETASGGTRPQTFWVPSETDLQLFTGRAIYEHVSIGEIRSAKGSEHLELRTAGETRFLTRGEAHGDVGDGAIAREMIRRTIQEHLDKEMRLRPLGIKVLSLFFVAEVAHYRQYDEAGQQIKGEYAQIFEEEYERFRAMPRYRTLFEEVDFAHPAPAVHDGYFSIDKTVHSPFGDVQLKKSATREAVEESSFNLIMRDKERLLSFGTPLKFIFSHSALREGWDNPNVFQICALREMSTEQSRRQTIGRGLRICVDQTGQRRRGFDINTLTVVGRERYQDFAANLQKEIEQDTGIRFGVIEEHDFQNVTLLDGDGNEQPLGLERSGVLWRHLQEAGHLEANGEVTDTLRTALRTDTLVLPDDLDEGAQTQVASILRRRARTLEVRDADQGSRVGLRREVLLGEDFRALWDRIKHRTTYRVDFKPDALVADAAKELSRRPPVPRAYVAWEKGILDTTRGGTEVREVSADYSTLIDNRSLPLPDLLTALQDRTQLTRRTIHRILVSSGRLAQFKVNPQFFIEEAASVINEQKRRCLVDGIKYQRVGDQAFYAQECFEQQELRGYLTNMLEVQNSIHEHVVYDSAVERTFAEKLDRNQSVKVFAKLPRWFQVPTPLGPYNPDWAVLVERDGEERLYLVVETKGSMDLGSLRGVEADKILYGEAHFAALAEGVEHPAEFRKANTVEELLTRLSPPISAPTAATHRTS